MTYMKIKEVRRHTKLKWTLRLVSNIQRLHEKHDMKTWMSSSIMLLSIKIMMIASGKTMKTHNKTETCVCSTRQTNECIVKNKLSTLNTHGVYLRKMGPLSVKKMPREDRKSVV